MGRTRVLIGEEMRGRAREEMRRKYIYVGVLLEAMVTKKKELERVVRNVMWFV